MFHQFHNPLFPFNKTEAEKRASSSISAFVSPINKEKNDRHLVSASNIKCEAQALGFILEGDGGSGYFSDLSKLPFQHACLILPDYKDLTLSSRDHGTCSGSLTPLERV